MASAKQANRLFPGLSLTWESAKKYSGALVAGSENNNFQFILLPNIEFNEANQPLPRKMVAE
jgi:hypothetical protein